MKRDILNHISNFLKYLLSATSALYILSYIVIALARIKYPFELEWLEGGVLEHVRRILEGKKLYVAPSLEFVTFIYTPLYFYLSALAAKVVGLSFLPLRLVSFISSLGNFLLIYLLVKRENQSRYAGLIATGFFAATFKLSAAWFDIARADSLYLFLLLAAIYLIRFKGSIVSYIFAGILISLSFLTKQTALVISLLIMLYAVIANWRRSIFFIVTAIILIFGSTILFDRTFDGWYLYYIYKLPSYHAITKSMILGFWTNDIMPKLTIAFVASLLYIFTLLSVSNKKVFAFYLLVSIGMVGGAWFTRLNWASYPNVLMPAHAMIAILFGLAIHKVPEILRPAQNDKESSPFEKGGLRGIQIHPNPPLQKEGDSAELRSTSPATIRVCVYLVCLVQFAILIYNPVRQIPTRADQQAGNQLVSTIAQFDGEVFVPSHGYLATLAGKNSYAHDMIVKDLLIHEKGPIGRKLHNEIISALEEHRFSAIILDNRRWIQRDVEKYYKKSRHVFKNKDVFWPVTGARHRPEFIYVPK